MNLKVLSGALLVTGTAIGAGMLALPVATCLGGFFPSAVVYLFSWLFMAATGLLFLEICLWLPQDANLVSMAGHLLGRTGKLLSWLLYIFLFYSLTIAYIAGGGGFIQSVTQGWTTSSQAMIAFTVIFGSFVYFGAKIVDRINMILMVGLVVSYCVFVFLGWSKINISFLKGGALSQALLAIPIIFTSFSYQGIVPSLTAYLKRDAKKVRLAILIGTTAPFFIYLLWQFLILGIVPLEGEDGLLQAKMNGQTAVYPLRSFVDSSAESIYIIGQAFAFFALTTSFLGVTLGLMDFLADGLKKKKEGMNTFILCLLVFIPPLLIALANPGIFLNALGLAGGIGCALLLGLMPIVMAWKGRYRRDYIKDFPPILWGGKKVLLCLLGFVLIELVIEIYLLIGT
jgi:tyrosine-specific transport protein